jgi:hypothetical protein
MSLTPGRPDQRSPAETYLLAIGPRLSNAGFELRGAIRAPGWTFAEVAYRKRFEITKFGVVETFVTIAEAAIATPEELAAFSEGCFRWCDGLRTAKLPRGFGAGLFVLPVVLMPDPSPAVVDAIRSHVPRKHWAGGEVPCLVDLTNQTVHVFARTPVWGAAYWRGFRKLALELLTP